MRKRNPGKILLALDDHEAGVVQAALQEAVAVSRRERQVAGERNLTQAEAAGMGVLWRLGAEMEHRARQSATWEQGTTAWKVATTAIVKRFFHLAPQATLPPRERNVFPFEKHYEP